MKLQILRVCVLLVSISAASVLVWNATRDQKPKENRKDEVISQESMLGSSKSKAVGVDLFEFEQETYVYEVTDEEVKRTREAMLSTSKSGRVMSDDQIREMLEERKKEKKLMPSSKSIDAILRPEDVGKLIQGSKTDKKSDSFMHSSKAPLGPLIDQKDLETIIEGKKQDSNDLQKLPPQEEKK